MDEIGKDYRSRFSTLSLRTTMRNLILTLLILTIALIVAVALTVFDSLFSEVDDNIFGTSDRYEDSATYRDTNGNTFE
jgi:hypothetical protein